MIDFLIMAALAALVLVVALRPRRANRLQAALEGQQIDDNTVESVLHKAQVDCAQMQAERCVRSMEWTEFYRQKLGQTPEHMSYNVLFKLSCAELPAYLDLPDKMLGNMDFADMLTAQQQDLIASTNIDTQLWLGQRTLSMLKNFSEFDELAEVEQDLTRAWHSLQQVMNLLLAVVPSIPTTLERWSQSQQQHATRRLRALQTLCQHYADHEACRRSCGDRLVHGNDAERLVAAMFLGVDEVLRLVPELDLQQVGDELWLEALDLYRTSGPNEMSETLWQRTLVKGSVVAFDAAVAYFRSQGRAAPLAPMQSLLHKSEDPELLVRCVRALTAMHGPLAEPPLLELLQRTRGRDDRVCDAVLQALARVGTVQAVPLLTLFIDADDTAAELRDSARDAITSVQERVQGETQGGLAIVDNSLDGALAISDVEIGQLGLVDDTKTR